MLPPRVVPQYTKLKSGLTKLVWSQPPRNVLVAKKDYDDSVTTRVREFLEHLHRSYPVNLLAEPSLTKEVNLPYLHTVQSPQELESKTDLVVTMGGDGTILHAISLFKHQSLAMPPVLSFSMGTLGFLLPFDYGQSQQAFGKMYTNNALVTKRSRLSVTMPGDNRVIHALNELTIHRGASPHLAELNISVNDQHLTTAIADGLSISTPSGSTAYSLSAGGSIVHPGVECILLTPICPRSLSFRPLLFPQDAKVSISMAPMSRGTCEVVLDGDAGGLLPTASSITVEVKPDEGVWCVSQGSETDDWVRHVNELLGFNSKFGTKGTL